MVENVYFYFLQYVKRAFFSFARADTKSNKFPVFMSGELKWSNVHLSASRFTEVAPPSSCALLKKKKVRYNARSIHFTTNALFKSSRRMIIFNDFRFLAGRREEISLFRTQKGAKTQEKVVKI